MAANHGVDAPSSMGCSQLERARQRQAQSAHESQVLRESTQAREPRGSFAVDGFWEVEEPLYMGNGASYTNLKRRKPEHYSEPILPRRPASAVTVASAGSLRPTSATPSVGAGSFRPTSATPSAGVGSFRPTSATPSVGVGSLRPTSATPSAGAFSLPSAVGRERPLSAMPQGQRPSSAPAVRKQPAKGQFSARRRPAKGVKKHPHWDPTEVGRGPLLHTKSALELRQEYIASQTQKPKSLFSRKHLFSLEDSDLHLSSRGHSEVSTETGDDDSDGDSDHSDWDDSERLERAFKRNTRLQVEAEAVAKQAAKLEAENAKQAAEIDRLNETIEHHEERVSFLEDADVRWREKNSALRSENQGHRQLMEHVRMTREDLIERSRPLDRLISKLRKDIRRKGLAFGKLPMHLGSQQSVEILGLVWKSWHEQVERSKMALEHQSLASRGGQLSDRVKQLEQQLEEQLARHLDEMAEIKDREADGMTRMQESISAMGAKAAKMLYAIFREPTSQELLETAWNNWRAVIPGMRQERLHSELTRKYETLQEKHAAVQHELATLKTTTGDLLNDLADNLTANERIGMLQEDLRMANARRMRESEEFSERVQGLLLEHGMALLAAEEKLQATEASYQAELAELEEEWQRRYTESETAHNAVQKDLRDQVEDLTEKVDDLQEALRPEGYIAAGRGVREKRVVARSRGVICAGCLTQIVHRDVQPIASAEDMQEERLDKEMVKLLENTLGEPDPHDPAHAWMWHRRKDPSNLLGGRSQHAEESSRPSSAAGQSRRASAKAHSSAGRPTSATPCARGGGMSEALRGEIAGFRASWRG